MNEGTNPIRVAYYLDRARAVAQRSEDPSTKTGCVIVFGDRVIAKGYNNMPHGRPEWWADREKKCRLVVHAEIDAITTRYESLAGAAAFIYPWMPCGNCCAALVNAGIGEIYCPKLDVNDPRYLRWRADFELVREYAREAGIMLVEVDFY